MYRKSFRNPHGTAKFGIKRHTMNEKAGPTIFQPVTLSGITNELSVLVMLHCVDSAIEVQVISLSSGNGCGVRIQAEAVRRMDQ